MEGELEGSMAEDKIKKKRNQKAIGIAFSGEFNACIYCDRRPKK